MHETVLYVVCVCVCMRVGVNSTAKKRSYAAEMKCSNTVRVSNFIPV